MNPNLNNSGNLEFSSNVCVIKLRTSSSHHQHKSSFEEEQRNVFGFARHLEPEFIIAAVRRPTNRLPASHPNDSLPSASNDPRLSAENLSFKEGQSQKESTDGDEAAINDTSVRMNNLDEDSAWTDARSHQVDTTSSRSIRTECAEGSARTEKPSSGAEEVSSSRNGEHVEKEAEDKEDSATSKSQLSEKQTVAAKESHASPSAESTHWFLIKWKSSSEADLVDSKEANAKCPQLVIQFYERKLKFQSREETDDENESQLDKNDPEVAETPNENAIASIPNANVSFDSEATEEANDDPEAETPNEDALTSNEIVDSKATEEDPKKVETSMPNVRVVTEASAADAIASKPDVSVVSEATVDAEESEETLDADEVRALGLEAREGRTSSEAVSEFVESGRAP